MNQRRYPFTIHLSDQPICPCCKQYLHPDETTFIDAVAFCDRCAHVPIPFHNFDHCLIACRGIHFCFFAPKNGDQERYEQEQKEALERKRRILGITTPVPTVPEDMDPEED